MGRVKLRIQDLADASWTLEEVADRVSVFNTEPFKTTLKTSSAVLTRRLSIKSPVHYVH